MNSLDKHTELTLEKVAAMQSGVEAGLTTIFGSDWDLIGSSGDKRSFGRKFKAAVQNKEIANIEWVRIENSGRYDVYRKL
jgi:hypothetical protein